MPDRALIVAMLATAHAHTGHEVQSRLRTDLTEACWPAGVADRHDPLARLNLRISRAGLLAIEPATPCHN